MLNKKTHVFFNLIVTPYLLLYVYIHTCINENQKRRKEIKNKKHREKTAARILPRPRGPAAKP